MKLSDKIRDAHVKMPEKGTLQRKEVLAERKDALEEQGEKATEGMQAIDPAKIAPDFDIRKAFSPDGVLRVSNQQPGYTYCWVFTGRDGARIIEKQSIGWEVVHGDMPEAKDRNDVNNQRRVGDTILMRCRTEIHQQYLDYCQELQAKRERGSEQGNIEALADSIHKRTGYATRGFSLAGTPNAPELRGMDRRSVGRKLAVKRLDKMMRDGTVPGVIPGEGR